MRPIQPSSFITRTRLSTQPPAITSIASTSRLQARNRLLHTSPLSQAPPKPSVPPAESDESRQARQRQLVAAAVQAAEQAKRDHAEAEKGKAELQKVNSADDAVRQRERIETARKANRALGPRSPSISSTFFAAGVRQRFDAREAGQTEIAKDELREEVAKMEKAEEQLRRANGGLPDFPHSQSGNTEAEGKSKKKPWSQILGIVISLGIVELLFPTAPPKKQDERMNEEEKKRADEAARRVAQARQRNHSLENAGADGPDGPEGQVDGWGDSYGDSLDQDRPSTNASIERNGSAAWKSEWDKVRRG